jgi:5'-3' exonuclease
MGIPFYFASLIRSHKGIVKAVNKRIALEVDVFLVDFNCLIHRYLQDENPIDSVVDALAYIVENICKSKHLILAMDGVVPYAKIVQQRFRRMRVREEGSGPFDRNQISPDTPYMRELETALQSRFPYAVINGTNIPGEGEHKIIHELQKIPESQRKTVCVYGLDADLILICLQNHRLSITNGMTLLREGAEFNDPSLKQAEFATMSIWKLLYELPMPIDQYMALGILCFGNDFMPNLGMFSLREDGYDRALHTYKECGSPNLLTKDGRTVFLTYAAEHEMKFFKERIGLRKRPEEKAIIGKDSRLFSYKYGLHVLDGVTNMVPVVEAYWKTFHWSLYYFKHSKPTDWEWVYPYADAPLIQDIVLCSEPEEDIRIKNITFSVTKQLQFIMPSKSLRTAKRRIMYPDEIHSETRNTWMKRHDWEMKPRISLPWNPQYCLTTVETMATNECFED